MAWVNKMVIDKTGKQQRTSAFPVKVNLLEVDQLR